MQITKRISGFLMALIMVINLFTGYTAPVEASDAKQDTKQDTKEVPYRNVMYYGEWSIYAGQKNFTPDKIDGSLITHLNFAFMDVDAEGNLNVCDSWADYENPNVGYSVGYDSLYSGVLGAMLLLRNKYPNMKIGISVGGWTRSGDFPKLAAKAESRENFAKNIAKFIHYYGYDFVDIDWEYPTADRNPDPDGNGVTIDKGCKGSEADTRNFTLLMQAIRDQLDYYGSVDGKYYELSCAMSASPAMMSKIEYDKVLENVDFANMMTYDLNGAWNGYTGHQTALYTNESYDHETQKDGQFSVDTCIKYLEDTYGNDIDYSKIVVGVAPYTRGWAGVKTDGKDPKNPGLYATAEPNSVKAPDGTTSGTFAYGDIDSLISKYNLKEYYDETAQAAYYYSADTGYFFTCDNERSVAAKGQYVREKHLGGLISWMASLDSTSSVTRTMKKALYGDSSIPAQKIVVPEKENVSIDVSVYGNTYTFTVKNNNSLVESSVATLPGSGDKPALPQAEKFGKSVVYPKFYFKTKSGELLTGDWSSGGTVTSGDGYTIITPPEWSGKTLEPGATMTFTLKSSTTADKANIAQVLMTTRAVTSGEELGTTVLYSDSSEITTTKAPAVTTKKEETTTKAPVVTTKDETTKTPVTTTKKEPDTTKTQTTTGSTVGTGSYPAWSPNNVAYALGAIVSYNGKVYECTYAHNSNTAWTPTEAFTLWKERADLIHIETTGSSTNPGHEETTTVNNYTVNTTLPEHMVTGYWHNFLNGSTALKLSDVPSYYDMICVSFANSSTVPGKVTFELDKDLSNALGGYTKAQFIQEIKELKAKGQHVIISVGGAEGTTYINDAASSEQFASSLISMIEEYGFEGVDIDFEGAAVSGTNYIASALRKVHNHFGDNFIITMAPETYYIQTDRLSANDITTAYYRLALEIKDILTICYPQFYNSGGMIGYGGANVNPGNADFLTSLSTLLLEGGLRPDQVAIGVPSTSKAAGSGYVEPGIVSTAVNSLVYKRSSGSFTPPNAYPTLRGVMTWSINWDATNGYAWAKAMDSLMDSLPKSGITTTTKEPTTTKTQITTTKQQPTTIENDTTKNIVQRPSAPTGLTYAGNADLPYYFAWTAAANAESYKVYVNGIYAATVISESVSLDSKFFPSEGTYTIGVSAVNEGGESEQTTISYIVKSSEVTTSPVVTTEEVTTKNVNPGNKKAPVLIGYYHTWHNSGNPFIKLRDVDSNWDIINISFAEPVSAGSTDGKMQFNISGLTSDYTKNDFKADIKALQAKGKKIVLSIGGYEGYFSLNSEGAINQFVNDIKSFVNEYGFDGIDIDLEQSSVNFSQGNDKDIRQITSPQLKNMTTAIRRIVSSYGKEFILSWAPETFYMQMGYTYYAGINQWCDPRAGSYLPMINALRDITTFVHVQLYNSIAITAPDGKSYSMGNKDAVVAMCRMLLDGFHVGEGVGVAPTDATWFAPLRADQVVIGVPSSANAAGSGQISNAELQAAFTELNNAYPGMGGIMTWSINWDNAQNNNSFARENKAFLSKFGSGEVPTIETTTQQVTTEAPTTEKPTQQVTTEAPTTQRPTEQIPTTEKQTEPPTTEKPTEVPSTEKPTAAPTEDKTTEAPTSGNIEWKAVSGSNTIFYNANHTLTGIVNVQKPGFAAEEGIYVTVPAAISKVMVNGIETSGSAIQGAGAVIYLSALNKQINVIEIEYAGGKGEILFRNAAIGGADMTTKPTETVTQEQITEKPTSALTTPAPVQTTTEMPTHDIGVKVPEAVTGLTHAPAGDGSLPNYFAWAGVSEATQYNFYINGRYVGSSTYAAYNADKFFKDAEDGNYTIGVTAVNDGGESKITTIQFKKATPKMMAGRSALETSQVLTAGKKNSAKKINITFKSVKGAKKYQIQIAKNKKFNKLLVKKIVKKCKLIIRNKKFAFKKKLYVRVRVKGAKVWSQTKRVKIK